MAGFILIDGGPPTGSRGVDLSPPTNDATGRLPGPSDGVDERPPPHVPAVWTVGPSPGAAIARSRGIPDHVTSLLTTVRRWTPIRIQTGSVLGRIPTAGPGAEERQSEAPEARARRASFPVVRHDILLKTK